jgi:hypothetical protein
LNRQDAKYAKKDSVKKWGMISLLLILLSACAVVRAEQRVKIALFAPFEGRYREIGYNALYAARLGLSLDRTMQVFNGGPLNIDLMAVDDGGSEAINHARALALDPLVMGVIALGYDATAPDVLAAFGDDLPVMIVGEWGAEPTSANIFILSNPDIQAQINTPARVSVTDAAALPTPLVGSDVLALEGFAKLRESLDGVTVLSSGSLPSENLIQLYRDSDDFAPAPGLLATLTFDATQFMAMAANEHSRDSTLHKLTTFAHPLRSMNGEIRFENGYWADAPIHRYVYVDGVLTLEN